MARHATLVNPDRHREIGPARRSDARGGTSLRVLTHQFERRPELKCLRVPVGARF